MKAHDSATDWLYPAAVVPNHEVHFVSGMLAQNAQNVYVSTVPCLSVHL